MYSNGAKSGSYATWTTGLLAIHVSSAGVSARVGSIGGGTRPALAESLTSSGMAPTTFFMMDPSIMFVFEYPADRDRDSPSSPAMCTCMPAMPASTDATGQTSTNASISSDFRAASRSA